MMIYTARIATILKTVLIIAILSFSGTYISNAMAEPSGSFDAQGNYVDGEIVWKTMYDPQTYEVAKSACPSGDLYSNYGRLLKWDVLPASLVGDFYLNVVGKLGVHNLQAAGWKIGDTWVQSMDDENYIHADFSNGGAIQKDRININTDFSNGGAIQKDSINIKKDKKFVICVGYPFLTKAGYYRDGKLLWSKVESKKMAHGEAVRYCNRKDDGSGEWRLPTNEELDNFLKTKSIIGILEAQGWHTISKGTGNTMWSSWKGGDVSGIRYYTAGQGGRGHSFRSGFEPEGNGHYVACVKEIIERETDLETWQCPKIEDMTLKRIDSFNVELSGDLVSDRGRRIPLKTKQYLDYKLFSERPEYKDRKEQTFSQSWVMGLHPDHIDCFYGIWMANNQTVQADLKSTNENWEACRFKGPILGKLSPGDYKSNYYSYPDRRGELPPSSYQYDYKLDPTTAACVGACEISCNTRGYK